VLSIHRLSLFNRLLAAFVFVVAVAFAVEAWLVIRVGEVGLERLVVENLSARTRERFARVERFLADRAGDVRSWSGLSVMDDVLVQDRVLNIENFLLEQRREQGDLYESLAVLDRSEIVIASSDLGAIGRAMPVADVAPRIEPGGQTRWSDLPVETPAKPTSLCIAQPIISELSTEPIGWLVALVRWDAVERLVANPQGASPASRAESFFLLEDANRRIVAGDRSRAFGAGWPTIGGDYLVVSEGAQDGTPPPLRGARLVAAWNKRDAFSVGRAFVAVVVASTALGVLLAAGVSFAIARYITRRLHMLVEGTGLVALGQLSYRVEERPDDEFGELARAFNLMAGELTRAREALEGTVARWKALVTHAPDVILTVDREGTILFSNRGVPGLTLEQTIGAAVDRHPPPEHASALRAAIEHVFQTGEPESLELEGVGPDEASAWYSCRIGPVVRAEAVIAVAIITSDITERKRLEKEVLEIAEFERARIGRDLHDGLGQSLTGTALLSKGLEQQLAAAAPEQAEQARRISALIDETIGTTRMLAKGLFPAALEEGGLQGALEELVIGVERTYGVKCRIKLAEGAAPEDRSQATHLFWIVQEAVNNAIRHGRARRIAILLARRTSGRTLMISDDGTGFEFDATPGGGMGLRSMRYRAGVLGGTIEVRSSPGKGARIVCRFS
jgi:PAS domain S-box-containing protein